MSMASNETRLKFEFNCCQFVSEIIKLSVLSVYKQEMKAYAYDT